jgi:NAD-dependent dihydropyrimidine dehydrogenase PreA subunit/flavodoxin
MIFYFSGTGNSLWVAKQLGTAFNERLISIADELKKSDNSFQYSLAENEKIFFVFPVHSWGPAVLMPHFIEKMKLENYTNQAVYSICVCGDNCGYTDRIMQASLAKKSMRLTHTYSIQMPNNYILMKGFGVDTKEVEQKKLAAAPHLIEEIVENIKTETNSNHYVVGGKPFLKSRIVYPLFRKFAIGKNKFYATDACTACGLCVKICPTNTISMKNGKPIWSTTCVQCTACIHRCPARAIEYGNITQNQGRYYFGAKA